MHERSKLPAQFMTSTSLDLSGKHQLRQKADALEIIGAAAKALDLSWFVVGATARDIMLSAGYGLSTSRITLDVDVAVNVRTWADYTALREKLLNHPNVEPTKVPHRLEFVSTTLVDIVPFGSIERNGTIEWPGEEREMNVTGFEEASRTAIGVVLPNNVIARVVSLPGLLLLKLIAWEDRHVRQPRHDAPDIREVLLSYSESWNIDRLYEEAQHFLEMYSYDPELAGAALLGADLREIVDERAETVVRGVLLRETAHEGTLSLAVDMGRNVGENVKLLGGLRAGYGL